MKIAGFNSVTGEPLSMNFVVVPRKGDFVTHKKETYEVVMILVDFDSDGIIIKLVPVGVTVIL